MYWWKLGVHAQHLPLRVGLGYGHMRMAQCVLDRVLLLFCQPTAVCAQHQVPLVVNGELHGHIQRSVGCIFCWQQNSRCTLRARRTMAISMTVAMTARAMARDLCALKTLRNSLGYTPDLPLFLMWEAGPGCRRHLLLGC